MIEAGVTFFELADYLHARNSSIGYALVNWNMTVVGAVAIGAHRSSLGLGSSLRMRDGHAPLAAIRI